MQEYQKVKVLVNSWDNAEPVTIQTHPSLDSLQVETQYVTKIILIHAIKPPALLSPTDHSCNRILKWPWNYMICPSSNKYFSSMMMINGCSARAGKTTQKTKILSSPSMTSSTSLPISLSPNNYCKDGYPSTRFTSCKKYIPPLPKLYVV